MKMLFPRRSRWLAILAMAATSTNPVASITGIALDALDEAMLTDLLQAYVDYSLYPASCTQESASTTFSFDWPGNNANSAWRPALVTSNHEELKFQAIMSHKDANGRSWDVRFGTGGDMYSHYTPDMYGETIPPQTQADSPWIDEVQQSVSVNADINQKTAYPHWCTGPISNRDTCKRYYIHQAGAYMRDTGYTDTTGDTTPFYSPSLAKHCSGNACMFASWGTQAHVVTPFTSPVIYINKYTNCGNGIIEHDQMIHNFAPAIVPASIFTTQSYFNIGWGGVRTSSLPIALEANRTTGALDYAINNENYLKTCKWGLDMGSGDNTATPNWRGERKYTQHLGGYTTFASNELLLNYTAAPWKIPCRTSMDPTCSTPSTCMVDSCTDAQVAAGYTRVQLQVGAGQTPRCWDYPPRDGHTIIQCTLRAAGGFGHSSPATTHYDKCAPWTKIGFKIRDTNRVFPVTFFLHYSFSPKNNKVYFATNIANSWSAKNAVTTFFNNKSGTTTMYIDVVDMSSERATSPPADYDPDNINAFTFVYGKASPEEPGWERRRLGWSERDYTVFTINWLGNGGQLQAGETLIKRGFYFVSNLASVKAMGDDLHEKSFLDQITLPDWSPRAVDIYQSGDNFAVMAAATSEGTSTECTADPTTTKTCSGFSTPKANHVPFFYITCGTLTYFGPDPYHFTPSMDGIDFPAHGTKSNFVRSYLCAGLALSIRPTWKMMGFFDPANTGCTALSSAKYNESEFTCPTGPTKNQTSSLTNGWDLTFDDVIANFTRNSEHEITVKYLIGKARDKVVTSLFKKDCKTLVDNVNGTAVINSTSRLDPDHQDSTIDKLQVFHDIRKDIIGKSDIYNSSTGIIKICEVIDLELKNMTIVSKKQVLSIIFNFTSNFEVQDGIVLDESETKNANDSVNFANKISVFKCDGEAFDDDTDAPLKENTALIICVKSINDAIQINKLQNMTITQASAKMDVILSGIAKYPSLTTLFPVSGQNGTFVTTRVPSNIFSFSSGIPMKVSGVVDMMLKGSARKLSVNLHTVMHAAGSGGDRILQANDDQVASFDVDVALEPQVIEGGAVTMNSAVTAGARNAFALFGMIVGTAYMFW